MAGDQASAYGPVPRVVEPVNYGIVRVKRGHPPSRGTPTLTLQLPAELARTWPDWATHVELIATDTFLMVKPCHVPDGRERPGPDREPPWQVPR